MTINGRVDVGLAIIAAGEMECFICRHIDRAGRFVKHVSDRAGLTVIDCTCPTCSSKQRRIICE